MEANLREIATGYRVAFSEDAGEPPYLTLDCEYLEQTSWGLLTSLTVKTSIPTTRRFPDGVILIDRINLMKGRDLYDMSRRIDQIIPSPKSSARADWQRHLEHAAVLINAELQKPVPAIDMMNHPEPMQQRFDIVGLLAENKTNILYGPGGTGKSALALRIAASLALGRDFLGLQTMHQGGTLYLDWEDDSDTLRRRQLQVAAGLGVQDFPLAYKCFRGRGAYERHHADIKHELSQNPGIRLVIFDSTAMAMHGGTSGDGADGAIKFFSLVGQLPATVLLIDHVASEDLKHGSGGTPKPFGSVFKVNSARNMWEVVPWNKTNVGQGFTMKHRKTNVGPKMSPIEVEVNWSKDMVTFDAVDAQPEDPNL